MTENKIWNLLLLFNNANYLIIPILQIFLVVAKTIQYSLSLPSAAAVKKRKGRGGGVFFSPLGSGLFGSRKAEGSSGKESHGIPLEIAWKKCFPVHLRPFCLIPDHVVCTPLVFSTPLL